jgi:hypothetical protein
MTTATLIRPTSIICGCCKGRHDSVALVRACYALGTAKAAAPAPVEVSTPPATPARTRLNFKAIPDGNYAVREGGVVKFYRVSTGKSGFKNVQVRASDELHMLLGKAGIAVLHRIVEAGLAKSQMLFVTELERCCKCGRSLTDENSRTNARVNGGYGPDCVGK